MKTVLKLKAVLERTTDAIHVPLNEQDTAQQPGWQIYLESSIWMAFSTPN